MTYSIVARDPDTGEIGVAVQTAVPGVGAICPWAWAGVGAVSTQALSRMSHGPSGIELMRNGHTAPEALTAVLAGDPDREVRQVGMIDAKGRAAAHTGQNTIKYAGHQVGEQYAVQANMMATDTVPRAMAAAFEQTKGALILRILAALEAAQAEGGDFRGQQSAALKIVSGELKPNGWDGVLYDLRVDDHTNPLQELRRLAHRQLAYARTDEAAALAGTGDIDGAMRLYEQAVQLDPTEEQLRFWFLLGMADEFGQLPRVEPLLRTLFKQNDMWVECLRRYAEARPLKTAGLLDQLVALA